MSWRIQIFGLLMALLVCAPARGVVTTWTVQSSSSSLTMSSALSSGGTFLASVSPQAPGSLTTTYGGTIQTAQSLVGGTPTDIAFASANLVANNNGNWDPLPNGAFGTSPGNYGGIIELGLFFSAYLAYRDLEADLTSAPVALTGSPFSPQAFTASLDFQYTSGTAIIRQPGGILGYALTGSTPGSDVAGGGSFASNGSISYGPGGDAGVATLTIPFNLVIGDIAAGGDTTATNDDIGLYYSLTGQIVATAPTATVPEASSLVLLGLAGSVIGFIAYRRSQITLGRNML